MQFISNLNHKNYVVIQGGGLDERFLQRGEGQTKSDVVFVSPHVINILFPHVWQIKPQRDDENYKMKITNGIHRRICIFKEIIEFVQRTKRFKREKYGI